MQRLLPDMECFFQIKVPAKFFNLVDIKGNKQLFF